MKLSTIRKALVAAVPVFVGAAVSAMAELNWEFTVQNVAVAIGAGVTAAIMAGYAVYKVPNAAEPVPTREYEIR